MALTKVAKSMASVTPIITTDITDGSVTSTKIAANSVSQDKLASGVQALLPKAWGQISAGGTFSASSGITASSVAANVYTITFAPGVITSNSTIMVTVGPASTVGAAARVVSVTPASNQITIGTSAGTTAQAMSFYILVF